MEVSSWRPLGASFPKWTSSFPQLVCSLSNERGGAQLFRGPGLSECPKSKISKLGLHASGNWSEHKLALVNMSRHRQVVQDRSIPSVKGESRDSGRKGGVYAARALPTYVRSPTQKMCLDTCNVQQQHMHDADGS